ncbi:MAG: T9SS type A sorting domain-containing protein [Agriterribacter sp.]
MSMIKKEPGIKTLGKILRGLVLLIFGLNISTLYAQNCTANAGGNATVCGSATTLTGTVSGTLGAGTPTWSFISGPVTPVIVTPNSLTTDITGMTADGDYVFQLSRNCGTGVATSTVTITAHPRPASFTAGPDITNVCATVGTTPLAGVIPTDFTGEWRAENIYLWERYGQLDNPNAAFDNTTIATPDFSLIAKADHTIDPAYSTILKITSTDNVCSYEDTALVSFVPNPQLILTPVTSICRDASDPNAVVFLDDASPVFATGPGRTAGSVAAGTTISLTVISQPAGGALAYNQISDEGRVFLSGVDVPGTYEFTLTITNSCGTHTTPTITYDFIGTKPHEISFQPAGHEAPEQLVIYSNAGSGGEIHCSDMAGTTTPENFYFSIDPSDPPTVVTDVFTTGTYPPGGAPTIMLSGAGTYDRTVTVTPPAGGWSIGTYAFYIAVSNGSCETIQNYYIHISDGNRPDLAISDVSACYPAAGAVVSATVPLPAAYQGVVNSSYLQDFFGFYEFAVISKPPGSADPTFTDPDLRSITSSNTTISNLDKPGDYVFSVTPINGFGGGPFLEAEYACSGALFTNTFTIHLEDVINANAGSDQPDVCDQTVSLLGNSAGAGTGEWTVVDVPPGANPNITAPNNPSTTVTNLDFVGQYRFAWTITTPLGGCVSADTVTFDVTCALPVSLTQFTVTRQSTAAILKWSTASESNNWGFEIEHSTDGSNWNAIAFQPSKAKGGNSVQNFEYNYTDHNPVNGTNFYRLKQMDYDGRFEYSPVRLIKFNDNTDIMIYPNPAQDQITIRGLTGNETITIYDITGRKVKQLNSKTLRQNIVITDLSEGIFYIHIISADGKAVRRQFSKLR